MFSTSLINIALGMIHGWGHDVGWQNLDSILHVSTHESKFSSMFGNDGSR